MADIVDNRLGLTALRDGEHDGGLQARSPISGLLLKQHKVIKVDMIVRQKTADREPLDHIGDYQIRKPLSRCKHFLVSGAVENLAKAVYLIRIIIINQILEG